ncbi:MAG: hypothetical protein ACI9DF_004368 [Verrucomicrobiales bacterium]
MDTGRILTLSEYAIISSVAHFQGQEFAPNFTFESVFIKGPFDVFDLAFREFEVHRPRNTNIHVFQSENAICLSFRHAIFDDAENSYSEEGNAFTRAGNTFTGNFANQIVGLCDGQHVSDTGSVRVNFAEPVDEVRLSLINRAEHPTPSSFQSGQQTWSFSVGDLRFDHDGAGSGAQNQIAIQTQPTRPTEPSTVRHALDLAFTPTGDLTLRLTQPLPISGPWGLESSTDLIRWKS